jgi:DNA-binding transcriptional regulator YiaG
MTKVFGLRDWEYNMATYRYDDCGLDNVLIDGVQFVQDDSGDEVVCIPNINGLHQAIAHSILSRKTGMSGVELRFVRTEMGLTQAELAALVHREPLAVSRWEREESPIDSNAEALIRLYAIEKLKIETRASVREVSSWCVSSATEAPIRIDGSDPTNYQPIAA